MNSKKRPSEELDMHDHWQQDSYRTGSTQPPKSHGGLLAFLLGLVIFLCGITTVLGLMNIKLRWQLNSQTQENANPIAFSRSAAGESFMGYSPLGFTGRDVTPFWNQYWDLPQGIYITDVDAASDAAKKGVAPRDILLSIDGTRITSNAELDTLLLSYTSGQSVTVGIHRDGKQMIFKLKLG